MGDGSQCQRKEPFEVLIKLLRRSDSLTPDRIPGNVDSDYQETLPGGQKSEIIYERLSKQRSICSND